jgi:pimeloyl-ACP methyl ester carboxylesterase
LNALRFDYFGTGDSGGDLLSARPGDWLEDIRLAAQELRERASVTRLVIVGLRFGGFLAAKAEVRAVGSLILWDPVTHPGQYLERARSQVREDGSRGLDWQGFYFPTELLDELADLSLEGVRRIPRDVKIIVSGDTPGLPSFERELEARRARVEVIRLDAPQAWFEEEELGAGAVPVGVLRQIKEWVI